MHGTATMRDASGTIVGLYLSERDIDNDDLEGFRLLHQLKWLEIRQVDIGDSSNHLSKMKSLETLDLRESGITDIAVTKLQR